MIGSQVHMFSASAWVCSLPALSHTVCSTCVCMSVCECVHVCIFAYGHVCVCLHVLPHLLAAYCQTPSTIMHALWECR